MDEIRITLSELKELLEVVTYLGIKAESERGRKAIKSAVEYVQEGDYDKSLESLVESCDFLKDKIDEHVDKELGKLKSRKETLLGGENLDHEKVDRTIDKLERAREENDYEVMPNLLFKTSNELKKGSD